MADDPKPGLGEGTAAAWLTIGGTGDATSANWAGYGTHGPSDASIANYVAGDGGIYNNASDAKQILEINTLEWFHLVQARYAITGQEVPANIGLESKEAMDEMYFKQRDMQLDNLVGAAQRIERELPKISQAHNDQQQAVQRLAGHWQGDGGISVQDKLAKLGGWSDDTLDEIAAIPAAVYSAVNEIKSCLQRKADGFARLNMIHRINGVDMTNGESEGKGINTRNSDDESIGNDDVSLIINYSLMRGVGDNVRERIQWIADTGVLGDRSALPRYASMGQGDGLESGWADMDEFDLKAQAICRIWTNQFCESARGYFTAYSTLCRQTDEAVEGYLKVAIDTLNKTGHLGEAPKPEESGPPPPVPSTPGPPGPPGPGVSTPGPGPGTPLETTPASTTPAGAQTNPAQQLLSTLAGQASQTVQQGVTQTLQQGLGQIQNVAQQGLGVLGGNLSSLGAQLPGAGPQLSEVKAPGTKQLANLSAFGGNLEVSQAADGTITAKVTGPDGKPQEYSMGIKDGMPFLKPGPAEADQASDDSAHGAGSGTDAGGPGPGPGGGGGPSQSGTPADSVDPNAMQGHSVDPPAGKSDSNAAPQPSGPGGSDPAQQGMPGMPGPGPGGAKPGSEGERSSNGLVPPKPLWTNVPGDGPPNPDGTIGSAPELATSGPLDGPPQASAGPELATSGPLNASHTADQAKSTPPAAAPNSGVKIEVDTGESK